MAKTLVIHACLILLTFCPGKGSRRKKIIENYRRDFPLHKNIYDWDNHNIYSYSEYPNYSDSDYDYDASEYINKELIKDKITWDTGTEHPSNKEHVNSVPDNSNHKSNKISLTNATNKRDFVLSISQEKWPKFEEILSAMGKRYDWKNDRWIKVKKKLKDDRAEHKNITSNKFHEKHRFIYRIVKLNRPKSKRNIILALTAIR